MHLGCNYTTINGNRPSNSTTSNESKSNIPRNQHPWTKDLLLLILSPSAFNSTLSTCGASLCCRIVFNCAMWWLWALSTALGIAASYSPTSISLFSCYSNSKFEFQIREGSLLWSSWNKDQIYILEPNNTLYDWAASTSLIDKFSKITLLYWGPCLIQSLEMHLCSWILSVPF